MSPFRCLFCRSCSCNYRIYTADGSFDEVACPRHGSNLEAYADAMLGSPGKSRMHINSSDRVSRQSSGHAESFAEFDLQIAEIKKTPEKQGVSL